MKKKLIIAAAIAFAVFAIPCGSSALSTVSVASENNTVATPAPSTKPVDEVKGSVSAIDVAQIKTDASAAEAKQALTDIGAVDLKSAMNDDASIINNIAAIEAAYQNVRSRNGILAWDKTKIDNNTEVKAVGIVGGMFVDSSTKLEMNAPAEKPVVTASNYVVSGDPVYVDITFKTGRYLDNERHSFDIPIAISVEVPAGIDGSKAVIFHFANSGLEAIDPIYNSADNTLTFAVNELSTFAIAEASATGTNASSTDSAFRRYRDNLASEIANAKDGATIKITRDENINALPNDIMQALYKKQTVALELEYTFEGNEYTVTIPAGKAEDNAIEWYGPLYLQMRYGK